MPAEQRLEVDKLAVGSRPSQVRQRTARAILRGLVHREDRGQIRHRLVHAIVRTLVVRQQPRRVGVQGAGDSFQYGVGDAALAALDLPQVPRATPADRASSACVRRAMRRS